MVTYKDVLSGAKILSDDFSISEVGGVLYEVDCAMVQKGDFLVMDVVDTFRLQPFEMDKRTYLSYLKGYCKEVSNYLKYNGSKEEFEVFMKGAAVYSKEILRSFRDYEFHKPKGAQADTGMIVLLNYREDGTTPYLVYWKHGLKEVDTNEEDLNEEDPNEEDLDEEDLN